MRALPESSTIGPCSARSAGPEALTAIYHCTKGGRIDIITVMKDLKSLGTTLDNAS